MKLNDALRELAASILDGPYLIEKLVGEIIELKARCQVLEDRTIRIELENAEIKRTKRQRTSPTGKRKSPKLKRKAVV